MAIRIRNYEEIIIGAVVELIEGKEEVILLHPFFTIIEKWTLVRDELREVLMYPLDPRLKKFIIAAVNSPLF